MLKIHLNYLKLSFFINLIFIMNTYAEYRVYQYYVSSKTYLSQDANQYLVTSTLDPVSYQSYHGGHEFIDVSLVRTWMCPGHTGHLKETCQSPYQALLEKVKKSEINDQESTKQMDNT